jgi:hypothetical protein
MSRMFARYKTYEGEPGSPEQWTAAAAAMVDPHLVENLDLLGLSKVPETLAELKQAHRAKIRTAHPDRQGAHDDAAKINAAAEALEKMIRRPKIDVANLPPPSSMLVNPPRCTADLPDIICDEPLTHAFTDRHVGEIKMNGEREEFYLGFDPYGRRQGSTMLSRQKAADDKMYGDKTGNVPHITGTDIGDLANTVLDGEVFLTSWNVTHSIMGSAPGVAVDKQAGADKITFYAFDIPYHKGKDIRRLPRWKRREILEQVVAELGNPWIVVMKEFKGDLDQAFRDEVAKGGEGLVVKHQDGIYGQGWAKYKKAADVSAFVIGFCEGERALKGQVGSLELGVYDDNGKVVSIGFTGTGFSNELRLEITANRDAWMGKVVDVFVFELTKRGQLGNSSFHRPRPDVDKDTCTMAKLKDDVKKVLGHRNKEKT